MICKANANSESLKCDDTNERIHFEEGKQVCEALSYNKVLHKFLEEHVIEMFSSLCFQIK
jgi:hypothetical protein